MRFCTPGMKFQSALDNMADVWINYNALVYLPQGRWFLHSETSEMNVCFFIAITNPIFTNTIHVQRGPV